MSLDFGQGLLAFGLGLLVAFICFGGLFIGVRLLFGANEEGLEKPKRHFRLILGFSILMGQFLVAAFVLYQSNLKGNNPVYLAVGMVLGIFACYLFLSHRSNGDSDDNT